LSSPETLDAKHDALAARVDAHDEDLAAHAEDIESLKLWRAKLEAQIAVFAGAGALVGGLISTFLGRLLGLH
jgi:hypothetical protein